jgi:hypothetical protein
VVNALEKWASANSRATLIVDDASGLTPNTVPWLVELEPVRTVSTSV